MAKIERTAGDEGKRQDARETEREREGERGSKSEVFCKRKAAC